MVGLDIGAWVSIVTAIVAALVGGLGVLGYQNRRARVSAVRAAFNDVITSLASTESARQLAGAILLRRFFDPTSELGVRSISGGARAAYASEAVGVIAAVLRGMPTGDLQKVLADGLAYAHSLERADLQRTNLYGAYLSPRDRHGSLERADFFRADLSAASLRGARAAGAVFYQARLNYTVLREADLRGANFYEADVSGAVFTGALLEGANFQRARHVPAELGAFIDDEGRYMSPNPAPSPGSAVARRAAVFMSLPSARSATQESLYEMISNVLTREGLATETLTRTEYPPSSALSEIYRRMSGCAGVIVFGLRTPTTEQPPSIGATPWTHVEAGMAYGCRLPLLLVREDGVRAGAFDSTVEGHRTHMLDVSTTRTLEQTLMGMRPWLADLEVAAKA